MKRAETMSDNESKVRFVRFCQEQKETENNLENMFIRIIENNFGKQFQTFIKNDKRIEAVAFKNWFEKWLTRIFNWNPNQFTNKQAFIEFLISHNSHLINSKDKYGHTPLTAGCQSADLETVKLLEKLGADINQTGINGRNALLCAAKEGKKDIVSYLHSKNKQLICGTDQNGDTAITLARRFADVETVNLLEKLLLIRNNLMRLGLK